MNCLVQASSKKDVCSIIYGDEGSCVWCGHSRMVHTVNIDPDPAAGRAGWFKLVLLACGQCRRDLGAVSALCYLEDGHCGEDWLIR